MDDAPYGHDRPPVCPACGVTMGIVPDDDGTARAVCLECGFADDPRPRRRP